MSYDAPAMRAAPIERGLAPAIAIRNLSKVYRIYERPQDRLWQMFEPGARKLYQEFPAVRGVDFEIRQGETVGIVGRNGSGKSTLLRMICGTLEPTLGEVATHQHVAPLLSLGAGFNREFTGRENVWVNGAIAGMSRREILERLPSIMAFADIGEFFDRPVKLYSAGMYSRLAFALAVNSNPEILVVDEVLAVGDEAFNRKCFARIEEIKRSGSTILFVSHVAERVVQLCDRAILMDAGECIYDGEPKDVIARYKQLVHAPPANVAKIRGDIVAANEPAVSESDSPALTLDIDAGYLDENLTTKSRVELAGRGTKIVNARVMDSQGEPVNNLRAGEIYTYGYEVEFRESAHSVRFGMMVKPVTGMELGGQVSHPEGTSLPHVAAGSRVWVRFQFRAALSSGAYFLNAGVLGEVEGAERYLHRILDATMFRVLPEPPGRVTGRVDLSIEGREPEFEVVVESL